MDRRKHSTSLPSLEGHCLWAALNSVTTSVTAQAMHNKEIHQPPLESKDAVIDQMEMYGSCSEPCVPFKSLREVLEDKPRKGHHGPVITGILKKYEELEENEDQLVHELFMVYDIIAQTRPIIGNEFLDRLQKMKAQFEKLRRHYDHLLFTALHSSSVAQKSTTPNPEKKMVSPGTSSQSSNSPSDTSTVPPQESSSSSIKVVRSRPLFPRKAQLILMDWLQSHKTNPYPTKEQKARLCSAAGITLQQLNKWFTNARMRVLKFKRSSNHTFVATKVDIVVRANQSSRQGKTLTIRCK
eukprot:TRINITY_DN22753_c0_g1_i1.p1 TRINITY_DN22753_c0_g1~~TRINITY_DN22753_c0_g1_i1.p1  ORF type:complete len:310 (+),score=71.52 TRINITY_DN22753_c0_g1_i1:40-930(+)